MNIYIIIIITYILKFIYSLNVGLLPDEAYYWEWSRHLDFSYYDQGPGVALYIKLFTLIFGDTQLALRTASNVASLVTTIFVFKISDILEFSKIQKIYLFLFIIFIPAFFAGGFLVMHDSPFLLSWSGALYFTVKYLKDRKNFLLYPLFLFLGLGALSKHTMVFYVFSLVIWILLSPKEFSIFKNFHFYFGILITFFIISPVLYWNLNHNWDNIDAIANLRSAGSINVKKFNTGSMIIGQIFSISPLFYLLIIFIFIRYFFTEISRTSFIHYLKSILYIEDTKSIILKFLLINSIILPLFFLVMSIFRVIQANWLYASYLPIALLLIFHLNFKNYENKLFLEGLMIALILDLFSVFSIPISKTLNLSIDPYYILGTRNLGFQEIADEVSQIQKEKYPDSKIITNRYQDAAILSWYLPEKPFINSVNILQKNQYNYWYDMEYGKDYILVYIQEKTCAKSFIFFQPILVKTFEKIEQFPEKDIYVDGYLVKRMQIWYLKNYQKNWAEDISNLLQHQMVQEEMVVGLKKKKETRKFKRDKMDQFSGIGLIKGYLERSGEMECSFLLKK